MGLRGDLPMFIYVFFLIVILRFLSGTYYTLMLTHKRQVSHMVVFFLSRYLVSRLIVLYLVYCLMLNAPFMYIVDDLSIITVPVICHLSKESYNTLLTDYVCIYKE